MRISSVALDRRLESFTLGNVNAFIFISIYLDEFISLKTKSLSFILIRYFPLLDFVARTWFRDLQLGVRAFHMAHVAFNTMSPSLTHMRQPASPDLNEVLFAPLLLALPNSAGAQGSIKMFITRSLNSVNLICLYNDQL